MTNQEIVCWFLWAKQYKLEELGCPYAYFTKEDEKEVLKFDSEYIKVFIENLISLLHRNSIFCDPDLCVYCSLQKCSKCSYLVYHGRCALISSTYQKTLQYFGKDKVISVSDVLGYDYIRWALQQVKQFYEHKTKWEYVY